MKIFGLRQILCALMLSVLAPLCAMAYEISGSVTDSEGEPLPRASVRLLTPKDSTQIKGTVSDDAGRYMIRNVNKGSYLLEISYVGYNADYLNVSVTDKNIRLKPTVLAESSVMLRETTVTGIKPPIKVMQDTVEFNADSYRTAPNAVVEDLLKRLPGVEVDSEGKITANGKTVSKILLDGREFFADDPKVASKNLPVNMIDKLQVVDRKSDLARITGVDDGEEETVINLTVKKGMNNGWVGNAEVGYGTDNRYKGTFLVNRFWNGNQLSVFGGGNNINDPAFTDGTSGRFRRFGSDNGITSSQGLGVNFNIGNKEIFRVGGSVSYTQTDRDSYQKSDRQYLFADSTSYFNSEKFARDKGHNINANFRVQWNPDSMNTFEFRPNISLNYSRSYSNENSLTQAGDAAMSKVTESINRDSNKGNSFEFGGRIIYNHKFRSRPGRSFSIFANYNISNVREKSDTYSWNKFFLFNDSIDLADRYTDNHTWSNNVSARLSWTEPVGNIKNGNFITLAYRVAFRWNNTDRLTYDHPVDFPDGWTGDPVINSELVYNNDLSNRFRNNYFNQDIRLGFKHISSTGNIEAGVSAVPQMSRSISLTDENKSIPTRWTWNVAPFLRYRYRPSKTKSLGIDYRGRGSQPSMTQLQPVADMSNPLRVVIGNPDLDPTFTHHISLRYSDFNPEAQRNIMTMADIEIVQNSIVSRSSFNSETGGSTTTYENVNGVWNARVMNMVSFPLRNKTLTFDNHAMLFYDHSVGYNNNLRNTSGNLMFRESFNFAWRPENAELALRPSYSLRYVKNTLQLSGNNIVHTYGATLYGTYYTPFGLVLNTDLNYRATEGYSAGYDTRQWMWNASISYQFLRDKSATISLKAYDLLQQKSNINRTITANYVEDLIYNSLTRYFMVSFSYKFNTFGKGKQPVDRNARGFGGFGGPGGPGGRGPMGPPR